MARTAKPASNGQLKSIVERVESEVWMPVLGYEGVYDASNLGRIRRGDTGLILNSEGQTGLYPVVSLCMGGVASTKRVHKLVLSAFCGPAPFEGAHAAHNNGDTFDCRLQNLRWATATENQADVDRHGNRCKGEAIHNAVLNEAKVQAIRQRIELGERNPSIARDFKVSISTVHLIRHDRIWRHVA